MKAIKLFFRIIVSIATLHVYLFCGFASDTLILTPYHQKQIQNFVINDMVLSVTIDGKTSLTHVTHTITKHDKKHLQLTIVQGSIHIKRSQNNPTIADQQITVARDQKFFSVFQKKWVKAKNLTSGDTIAIAIPPGIATIKEIKEYENGITLHDIRLADNHVFCITDLAILVHNCGFMVAAFSNPATILQAGTLAATGITATFFNVAIPATCALYLLYSSYYSNSNQTLKNCGNSQNKESQSHATCASSKQNDASKAMLCGSNASDNSQIIPNIWPTQQKEATLPEKICNYQADALKINNPSDHDNSCIHTKVNDFNTVQPTSINNPPQYPNGIYEPSPAHKDVRNGRKSPGPNKEEGQKALDLSIPVYDENEELATRVVTWGGQFIVFQDTTPGVWHGYYVSWEKQGPNNQGLRQEQKQALNKAGMAHPKSGKILKDMKFENQ